MIKSGLLGAALLCTLLSGLTGETVASANPGVVWQPYDDSVFERARAENKIVLLNLEAVWCHWCHVMAAQTYSDPQVQALLARHFIAVKVDQDARPDLSTRYREWGWPATIFLNGDGTDVVKRAGFIGPVPFARLLQAIVADPTPEPASARPTITSYAVSATLPAGLRASLLQRHEQLIDPVLGGLRTAQKRIDRDALEFALRAAGEGDAEAARYARTTLDAARGILDPVWGGFYQYSTGGDWQKPHFEKLMRIQAAYLRSYALAYGLWRDPKDLATAMSIITYVDQFLTSPEGAFRVSQDADLKPGEHAAGYFQLDDEGRRAEGIPRVDENLYARENGVMIEALLVLFEFTGDRTLLDRANQAATWVARHRLNADGGFRHDDQDSEARYLADNLAMARALLQFYRVTADRRFLRAAMHTASYMNRNFRQSGAGVLPVRGTSGPLSPVPDVEDNISYARFNNLMFHYSGDATFQDAADHAMRFLATEQVALAASTEVGILLADHELANDPLHLTVRAGKRAQDALALFEAAQRVPGFYKRIEWWDEAEGPLPNPDVTYPNLPRPAAFVCTNKVCSVPLFTPSELSEFVIEHTTAQPLAADGR